MDEKAGSLFSVLAEGATVSGLAGPNPVKILSVDRLTDDSASVAYRTEDGLGEKIVFADMLPHLKAVKPGIAFTFDASPEAFLLAAEARRMRLAHLFDPLAALGTSAVDPLPHQLRAVYGEMLPRQPLRYVLADDPPDRRSQTSPPRRNWESLSKATQLGSRTAVAPP